MKLGFLNLVTAGLVGWGGPLAAGTIAELEKFDAFLTVGLPSVSGVSYTVLSNFSQFATSDVEQLGTTVEPVTTETVDSTVADQVSISFGTSGNNPYGVAKAENSADEAEMFHVATSSIVTVTNGNASAQTFTLDLLATFEVFWYDTDAPLTKITSPFFNFGGALAEAKVFLDGAAVLDQFSEVNFNTTSYVDDTLNEIVPTYGFTLQPNTSADIELQVSALLEAGFIEDLPEVVPLPASAPLFASALILLGWARRRTYPRNRRGRWHFASLRAKLAVHRF